MGTRYNGYYDNPQIGEALTSLSNLAGIFAPPAAQDVAAYAQAAKLRQETQGLTTLYQDAQDPNFDQGAFDRMGIATGQWAPTQGYHALDVNSADTRRGQDTSAAASRYGSDRGYAASTENNVRDNATTVSTNALDNRVKVLGDLLTPMNPDQRMRGIDADMMAAVGYDTGAVAPARGLPAHLSQDQVMAAELEKAIGAGDYGPADAVTAARSAVPTDEIVDAAGQPKVVYQSDAVGQVPYTPKGSEPAKDIVQWLDPNTHSVGGRGIYDPSAGKYIWDGGVEPPPNASIIKAGAPQGTMADMTTGASTDVQNMSVAITDATATLNQLQSLVNSNPNSQGLVGLIRGTAQDFLATGSDLAKQFGGPIADLQQAVADDPTLATTLGANVYDPSIPAISLVETALSWQLAKVLAGGNRVSNQQIDQAQKMIGAGGWVSNKDRTNSGLAAAREFLTGMANRRAPLLPTQLATSAAAQLPQGDQTPPPGTLDGVTTIADDAGYAALPSGALFKGPDGLTRKKP